MTTINVHPQALVAAIKNGDERAFSEFYMGYVDSLVRFLSRVIGSEDDAKEVAQDVFATLWERRESLEVHTSLHGFVFGVARNMAFRLMRDRRAATRAGDDMSISMPVFSDLADEGIITLETSILLDDILRKMPPQRRRVFELSREEGLTYSEIAERMGVSLNTVRTHMTLALRELRAALALAFLWYLIV